MAGRYEDESEWREREARQRYDDRYDVFGGNDERGAGRGREDRSFERDRVFGERETGVAYNRPPRDVSQDYRSHGGAPRGGRGWQDQSYGGVSPAMHRGDYDTGYRANPDFSHTDYTRGGSFRGDEGREQAYRGGPGYGRPSDGAGRRFGSSEADQRWAREMRRPASGGTGGYDYERGYGDAGRTEGRDHGDFEDRAREAGEFVRRAGRRVSNWFSDVAGEGADDRGYGEDRQRYEEFRGARGRGPKGYQRADDRINDEVHQRLTDDHWLDASEIDVAVANGDVTLSGTVESREAKHRAERIVEDLSGVKHVQNNLRIQAAGHGDKPYGETEPRLRSEGDAANLTSATAKSTTTRGET